MQDINEKRAYITDNYAQKCSPADRLFKLPPEETCYSPMKTDLLERDEFTTDKDRILFSRPFRRLEHKAQIYTHAKGDHFRNRLTHSLEVAQIAKSIARNLGLNEDLTEAIALGHDVGHTPFGHAGERILDEVMSGKNNLDGMIKHKINYGGFKHNFQGLKTIDIMERKYETIKGLNLTWQVKEGVLKHTRTRKCKGPICTCDECWELARFCQNKEELEKFLEYPFSCTLEGQIVAVADEIAQRQHDLDDGLRDADIKELQYDGLAKQICSIIDSIVEEKADSDDEIIRFLDHLKNKLGSRISEDAKSKICRRDALIRDVIEYFILDVTYHSFNTIINDNNGSIHHLGNIKYVDECLVDFTDIGQKMSEEIENYIKSKIVNSESVNLFDERAKFMIKYLFKGYYFNPRLLTSYGLFRLHERVKNNYNKIYNLKLKNSNEINGLDIKSENINEIIKILKLNINIDDFEIDSEWGINQENIDELLHSISKKSVKELESDKERFIKCLLENHYAYLSLICDHISGMTDNYARDVFSSMYSV